MILNKGDYVGKPRLGNRGPQSAQDLLPIAAKLVSASVARAGRLAP
jgi:hypothetical protein